MERKARWQWEFWKVESLPGSTTDILQVAGRAAFAYIGGAMMPIDGPFSDEIRAMIAADASSPLPSAPVLFYGSSSIRLWTSLAQDFPERSILNRGFGGSKLADCITYFDLLVKPYEPGHIVLYAGDNDLAEGATPKRISLLFAVLMHKIRTAFPETPVTFISIKACPARWSNRKRIVKANALVKDLISSLGNVSFLDVFPAMQDPSGQPDAALFDEDGLHLSAAGYRLWAQLLRLHLNPPRVEPVPPAGTVSAVPGPVRREFHRWHSPRMNRDMELLIFGHAGPRMIAFPTRCSRFFEYENRGMVDALRHFLEEGRLQLFCVDSVDEESFYCDWKTPRDRIERHLQYERYLLHEVIPLTQRVNSHPDLLTFGCSMGAYHAVNIALRYPHLFRRVMAFSGRYDLTQTFDDGFGDLLSGYYDEHVYLNTPSHFMPNLQDGTLLEQIRKLDVTLVVGEEDPFHQHTREFSRLLWEKGVWHALHVWTGRAHRFRYWRQMLRIYYPG